MKVLIFGPSGSGKSFVAKAWKQQGINAFDDDEIDGLSNWYDRDGKKVSAPATADEALDNGYAFLWSKKAMARFLAMHPDVFVFGGSGNIANVFDLFDRVYFLKIDSALQLERLKSPLRPTPQLDSNADGVIVWGQWLEELAQAKGIPFIEANQTPAAIYEFVKRDILNQNKQ